MLGKAGRKALMIYRGIRPEEVAEREGIEVKEFDAIQSVDDVLVPDVILIPPGLLTHQRRWRIAHCLGHYFMHQGNQVWCGMNGCMFHAKQERQADVFAACLLTGRDGDTTWASEELQAVKVGRLRK